MPGDPVRANPSRIGGELTSRAGSPARPVIHPITGEVLDRLDQQPPELLAETLHAIHDRQAQYKTASAALEAELHRRLTLRGRTQSTFGHWEVSFEQGNESVWDGDELETALRALIDDGVLDARECVGVITHDPTVHRTEANKLIGRLSGGARHSVERCRTWRPKGRGRIVVARSVALPSPDQLENP